jgi:tol-pal system protein YbgF
MINKLSLYCFATLVVLSTFNTILYAEEIPLDKFLEKLETIESRIKVLEKATFNNTTSGQANNLNLDDYQSIIAKQSIQIAELQNEIQSLTAQIEEMIFTMQSTVNNFNTFKEDAEFRFTDLNTKAENIEKVQNNSKTQTLSVMQSEMFTANEEELDLEPKSLGTINMTSLPVEENSPFEVKIDNDAEEQQIINTISQDNIVSLGEQKIPLSILPESDEESQYEYAINLLKQGDYETAEKAFTEFISIGDDKNYLSNSHFWLAETYYVRENYKDAAKNYLNLYQTFPNANKAPDALLKLGISLVNMQQKEQGCMTFIQLQESYPEANPSIIDRSNLELKRNGCEIS